MHFLNYPLLTSEYDYFSHFCSKKSFLPSHFPQRSYISFFSKNHRYSKIPGADEDIRFYFIGDEEIISRPVCTIYEKTPVRNPAEKRNQKCVSDADADAPGKSEFIQSLREQCNGFPVNMILVIAFVGTFLHFYTSILEIIREYIAVEP
jgi:hypothetical protein